MESALDLIQRPACAVSSNAIDFYRDVAVFTKTFVGEIKSVMILGTQNTRKKKSKAMYLLSPLYWIFLNEKTGFRIRPLLLRCSTGKIILHRKESNVVRLRNEYHNIVLILVSFDVCVMYRNITICDDIRVRSCSHP